MADILRKSDTLLAFARHSIRTLALVMVAASSVSAKSPEAMLEAAMYRETVAGDLRGAIDQYKSVIETSPKSRATTARAYLQMGLCFEKSGRRAEARAVYTRLVSEFADQPKFTAQARTKLYTWSDEALPDPPQLTFPLSGPGNVPPGWFYPVYLQDGGYKVVLIPAGAPIRVTGDMTQGFSAAPYRGKNVRLRARLHIDVADPDVHPQLWISIDRPKGPGDRIADRPPSGTDWTVSTVSTRVDEDATYFNFGITSTGRGRVSAEDVWLEIVP